MKNNIPKLVEINTDFKQKPAGDDHTLEQQFEELQKRCRYLETALHKAESAVIAQREFLANMSHDLRTPLHTILSYSRFGIEKIERLDKEKTLKYFSSIEKSGKKLEEMLNQIVDLSKLESGKMAFQMYSINPSLIVTSLLKEHKDNFEKKIIDVKTSFPDDAFLVTCDQNKISQVMSSLLNNAVHYSPENETISIVVEDCVYPDNPLKKAIKISFRDQREERISQEVIDDFAAFIAMERKKTGGRVDGISLAIAFEIVKHHHGLMEVQNCDPKGVSYSITLPLHQPT